MYPTRPFTEGMRPAPISGQNPWPRVQAQNRACRESAALGETCEQLQERLDAIARSFAGGADGGCP